MAKDPAFLFYYDRFLSGTISMTDAEVGQYVRLMCIQANKGYISKKDMLHICKSYDNDVCLKFTNIGEDKYANAVLTEIVEQRKNYTESRRTNRKGKKSNNISSSYVNHMVNKDVNVNKEEWIEWAELIVTDSDHQWHAMKGKKVTREEMDAFLSVATRNEWKMNTQSDFRISLKGFKSNGHEPKEQKNKYKIQ